MRWQVSGEEGDEDSQGTANLDNTSQAILGFRPQEKPDANTLSRSS